MIIGLRNKPITIEQIFLWLLILYVIYVVNSTWPWSVCGEGFVFLGENIFCIVPTLFDTMEYWCSSWCVAITDPINLGLDYVVLFSEVQCGCIRNGAFSAVALRLWSSILGGEGSCLCADGFLVSCCFILNGVWGSALFLCRMLSVALVCNEILASTLCLLMVLLLCFQRASFSCCELPWSSSA